MSSCHVIATRFCAIMIIRTIAPIRRVFTLICAESRHNLSHNLLDYLAYILLTCTNVYSIYTHNILSEYTIQLGIASMQMDDDVIRARFESNGAHSIFPGPTREFTVPAHRNHHQRRFMPSGLETLGRICIPEFNLGIYTAHSGWRLHVPRYVHVSGPPKPRRNMDTVAQTMGAIRHIVISDRRAICGVSFAGNGGGGLLWIRSFICSFVCSRVTHPCDDKRQTIDTFH